MEYKLGVVGSPIEHSLSPEIHNIFAQELNIKISYEKYLVDAGELSSFCNQFFDNPNALGLNVTLPLKKEVLELDANKSSIVNKIHSANTIKKSNESLYLHSTDGQGLVNDLSKKGILIKDKKVLILGAGGSAASIIPAISGFNPISIEIANRSEENAKKLIGRFGESVSLHEYGLSPDIVINCSSAGHDSSVPEFFKNLEISKDCILYDLSYGNSHKPTRNWFKKYSQYIYSGEGMLVEQAALSFEYWFGKKPTTKNIIKEIL